MKKLLLIISILFTPIYAEAEQPETSPGPALPVTVENPLPLPVDINNFPGVQNVNVVSPDPLPVDIGSGNVVDIGNLPNVQDVNIANTAPVSVSLDENNALRILPDQGYMLTMGPSSVLGQGTQTIPFDSVLVGVLIATQGKTDKGFCTTKLAYSQSNIRPAGAESNTILETVLSTNRGTSDNSGDSIYLSLPDLFIEEGGELTATAILPSGSGLTNRCSSILTLYLRGR